MLDICQPIATFNPLARQIHQTPPPPVRWRACDLNR
jgi:hypothetical protein